MEDGARVAVGVILTVGVGEGVRGAGFVTDGVTVKFSFPGSTTFSFVLTLEQPVIAIDKKDIKRATFRKSSALLIMDPWLLRNENTFSTFCLLRPSPEVPFQSIQYERKDPLAQK